MKIAVDISLYPLTEDYLPPIEDLIARLGGHPGIEVAYNALSTQVRGEYDAVFDLLRQEFRATFAGPDRAVIVVKMIGGPPPSGAA